MYVQHTHLQNIVDYIKLDRRLPTYAMIHHACIKIHQNKGSE